MSHLHYEVQGYIKADKKKFVLHDVVGITVLAESSEEAIERAKNIVTRPKYRIARAWECWDVHGFRDDMAMTSLEIQKQLVDALKTNE